MTKLIFPAWSSWLRLIAILACIGQCGCRVTPPLAATADPALLEISDQQRMLRQQLASVSLETRIAAIEADMLETLVAVGDGVLVPRSMTHRGRKGPVHLESNAAVLVGLAAKYAATGDEQAKVLAEEIVKGVIGLDALTGDFDGLIAFYADARTLDPTDHATHVNAYTQLLFAYVIADTFLGPNEEIQKHVSQIYQRFVDDGFLLRQVDGRTLRRADVRGSLISFNARRAFDRRLLDEAAYHLGDAETRRLVEQHRWRGPLLGPMHVRFFAIELPTTSSSWLNLQALTGLTLLGEPYERRVTTLAKRYDRDNNPFFRLLAAIVGADEDLTAIRRRLEEFPYPATTSGIINSHRDEVGVAGQRFTKFNATPESHHPLPLYEVRSTTYLWKRRLREIDSMPEENPQTLLGHDLYQAYWLLRAIEKMP